VSRKRRNWRLELVALANLRRDAIVAAPLFARAAVMTRYASIRGFVGERGRVILAFL
jgi:hypothetical protein